MVRVPQQRRINPENHKNQQSQQIQQNILVKQSLLQYRFFKSTTILGESCALSRLIVPRNYLCSWSTRRLPRLWRKPKIPHFQTSRELIVATPFERQSMRSLSGLRIPVLPFLVAQASGLLGVAVIEKRAISELP
jgi:hypothetical protein